RLTMPIALNAIHQERLGQASPPSPIRSKTTRAHRQIYGDLWEFLEENASSCGGNFAKDWSAANRPALPAQRRFPKQKGPGRMCGFRQGPSTVKKVARPNVGLSWSPNCSDPA